MTRLGAYRARRYRRQAEHPPKRGRRNVGCASAVWPEHGQAPEAPPADDRPKLRRGLERYGVDVSAHQEESDWSSVAGDDIDFAYIKATEGGDSTDHYFTDSWDAAGEVGLDRGAYHFFTLCTPGDAQAEHFLTVAPPEPEALAPAVDLEIAGNCSDRPSQAEVDTELDVLLEEVEEAWDRQMVLYIGDDWDRVYPTRDRLDRPLWHRRILLRPDVDGWTIWQIHGMANVDGIDGPADLNIMRPAG